MKKKKISYARYGYIFSIPFVTAFALFTLYPILYTIFIGFTDLKGLITPEVHVLWDDLFANYKDVLAADSFKKSVFNTVFIWSCNFLPQLLLALVLAAWFTNTRRKIKGQGAFKVLFYMPNIITAATVAILFRALFGYPMGPINDLFTTLGISAEPIQFFQNKWVARGTVAFIQFWQWYGYTMIVLISGILGINPELFEASEIDGATNAQTFFYVTLPNLRTIMIFTLITSLIGGLQMFDIPKLLVANSGPGFSTLTTSVYIYNQAFSGSYKYNTASAASVLLFIACSVLSAIVFAMMQDKHDVREARMLKKIAREEKKAAKLAAKEGR